MQTYLWMLFSLKYRESVKPEEGVETAWYCPAGAAWTVEGMTCGVTP